MKSFFKKSSGESSWDQKSFRIFFDLHHQMVFRRLYVLLNDQAVAEELCQDIFISLWQRRLALPSVTNWEAYLLKSATFKAIDWRRKGKDLLSFTENIEAKADQLAVISEEEDLRLERLEREIEALPERCRDIFKLSRYE